MTHNGAAPSASVSRGRCVAAWTIDFALLAIIASGVAWLTYSMIIGSLKSVTDIGSMGVSHFLSSQGDWQEFGTGIGIEVLQNIRLYAAGGLVAVVVLATAYFWLSSGIANRTLGMALVDIHLGRTSNPSEGPGWNHSLWWAALRAVTDIGIFAAACVAPMFGAFVVAVALWVISVTWLFANGVAALAGGRSLVDRLAGVVLVSANTYAAAARVARGAAVTANAHVQNLSTQPRVAQTVTAATDLGRQAADRTRQAMESDRALQAADAGRRAAQSSRRFAADVRQRFNR